MHIIGADKDHAALSKDDIEEMRAWGADVSSIKPDPPKRVEVWYDNTDAIRLFNACHPTQWREGPAGGRIGLDYGGLEVSRQWLGIEPSEALLMQIKYCEVIAINYWASKSKK